MTALTLFTNCGTLRVIKGNFTFWSHALSRIEPPFSCYFYFFILFQYFLVCHFHIRVVRFNWYCHVLKLKNTNNYLKLWPLKDASSPQLMLKRKICFLIILWVPLRCSFILSFLFHILFAIVEKKVRSSEKRCHLPRFVVVIPLFQWQLLLISDICSNVFFSVSSRCAHRWRFSRGEDLKRKQAIHPQQKADDKQYRRRLW